MNVRRITSLTALVSFFSIVVTAIVLYIVPAGRVAYWADWRLWGLTKEQWTGIHVNLGILFLISIALHIYYNWKPILNYLKNKAKELKVFTKEFNVALIITIIFILGTYVNVPPFRSILEVSDSIKDAAAVKYGEPPYGHAELSSLKSFSKKMKLNLSESMDKLKNAGIRVESEDLSLKEIARMNMLSPQQVYLIMAPSKEKVRQQGLPENPKPGLGKLLLSDICKEYGLNTKTVVRALEKQGIQAKGNMTMKEIASQNSASPIDIYEAIKIIGTI